MANWSVKQVTNWLKENGFQKQVKIFREKNIDGHVLLRLTDQDISQLFVEVNEGGTIEEATIGVKSRFRTILTEWKMNHQNDSSTISSVNMMAKEVKMEESTCVKREATYLVDNEIEIRFFQNRKFLSYFLNYVKQEIPSVDIEVKKLSAEDDEQSGNYTIKLTGTKQQNRTAQRFIKHFLESIQFQTYDQKNLKNWTCRSKPIEIIQNVLDNETDVFTVCQLDSKTLKIYYFDNRMKIDQIIQTQIIQEKILWTSVDSRHIVEFIPFNTHQTSWIYQICQTEQFFQDSEKIFTHDDSLLSITAITKRPIEIFGQKESVNNVLKQFKDVFEKHRLRKYRFSQLSSNELDCLGHMCSKEFHSLGRQYQNNGVRISIEKNQFYAPQCLKNTIRDFAKSLLSNLKTKNFENIDFYWNTADGICSDMKNIAKRNHCYCQINQTSKFESYPIPKGHGSLSHTSPTTIEQSNLFTSSPLVSCRAKFDHGSIEVRIGDIAIQKVDVLVIPSTTFGLKESLIERAGPIHEKNSIPFLTETTGGNLNCQKILFVNWSLPTTLTNDDESIRFFISKSIQYVGKEVQSIAFAVPDSCQQENILAEEMIEETIKSLSMKVSFILLSDQVTLYQQFLNTIEKVRQGENQFGSFSCPTSTVTISLMSFKEEHLTKCEDRINKYLNSAIFKTKLDGFEHWNQYLINAFYKYATDRCVLPKTDSQQQIVLHGPVSNVYEVSQKYQLTNALIQQKITLPRGLITGYNIMLSYAPEDSVISHRLANRLIDEGFAVWINPNPSIGLESTARKINKSDCVILCISENYFPNQSCEKEAKYAVQRRKSIIPIKVQYYQPIDWLKKLIEKESFFQIFGSDHQFNFEYEKILLKIVSLTNLRDISSLGQSSPALQQNGITTSLQNNFGLFFLLTQEQKRLKYEKTSKKMTKLNKGKISEDEKKDLFEEVQGILQWKENQCQEYLSSNASESYNTRRVYFSYTSSPDYQEKTANFVQRLRIEIGIISNRQWLEKLGNWRTILNMAPFTFTGDVNDAVFPLLNDIRQSNLLATLRKYYFTPIESDESSKKFQIPFRYCSTKRVTTISSTDQSKTEEVDAKENDVIPRSVKNKYKVQRYNRVKKEKSRRIIPKKWETKSTFTSSEKREFQSKFAEQIQRNIDEFEKFCDEYKHVPTSTTYPTAIFGPNPFSAVIIESRKRVPMNHKKELPLKFPWNDVFDTEIPTVKWKDSSIFFFFETTLSE